MKCEGRQEEELIGLTSRSNSLEEIEDRIPGSTWQQKLKWLPRQTEGTWQYIRRHFAVNTESDFPRRIEGTSTVHWKHLAAESAARRLLLSCSGAGSTELSPKPAGPYEGFGRRNQDLLAQNADVTPPGRLKVLWQYIRRHLAADTGVTPQADWRYLASTLGDSWQ